MCQFYPFYQDPGIIPLDIRENVFEKASSLNVKGNERNPWIRTNV